MKKKTIIQSLFLLCALIVGSTNAWADADYTYTLAEGDFSSSSHSKTSGTITWTHSHTSGTESYGWDAGYGFKFGSSNSSYPTAFKLTSSSFSNKIKKVVVTASVNSKKSCLLDVKVGSTTYGSQATINTKNSDAWEFEIADESTVNGAIELSFSSNTGPLYLEKIEVYYHNVVTSLSVKTAPTKVRYEVGETLDMTGFVLDADGNDVSAGYTMTMGGAAITNGATLSSAGKKTLVVSYGGKTVDQPISVGNVTRIEVTTPPTKTTYDTGDSFDATGMIVTASLSTGELESPDEWTKAVTGYTVDPEDDLVPANTYVTITYATRTVTQNITVTNVAVTGVSVKASTTIEKTKTETLTPTFTPTNATNKNVSWESDNEDVATVTAAGVVAAVAAGTANITVTTEDGGKTAICVVTVVNQKGTIDTPYTVAEVINGEASGKSDVYVIGYIVGNYNATSPIKSGSSLTQTNLAIADNPGETDGGNTVPVELINSNSMRPNWGPSNKPYLIDVAKILIKGNGQNYFSTYGIKGSTSITTVAEAVKVSSAGYGTWASDNKLDFTGTSISAYKATVDGTEVNFTQVNVVPANSGILLYADGGASIEVPVTTADADVFTGNKLVRGTGASLTYVESTAEYYILSKEGDDVGFYKANGNVVSKTKAYLDLTETNAKSFVMPGGETDGIRSIENGELKVENNDYYNLSGQRVSKDYKGIVIVNGKKYLRK